MQMINAPVTAISILDTRNLLVTMNGRNQDSSLSLFRLSIISISRSFSDAVFFYSSQANVENGRETEKIILLLFLDKFPRKNCENFRIITLCMNNCYINKSRF